jgi:hypothetical protein
VACSTGLKHACVNVTQSMLPMPSSVSRSEKNRLINRHTDIASSHSQYKTNSTNSTSNKLPTNYPHNRTWTLSIILVPSFVILNCLSALPQQIVSLCFVSYICLTPPTDLSTLQIPSNLITLSSPYTYTYTSTTTLLKSYVSLFYTPKTVLLCIRL